MLKLNTFDIKIQFLFLIFVNFSFYEQRSDLTCHSCQNSLLVKKIAICAPLVINLIKAVAEGQCVVSVIIKCSSYM